LEANFTQAGAGEQRARFPWVPAALLLILGSGLYRLASGGKGFDISRFLQSFASLDYVFLALAIFLIILSYLGRAIRWEVMMRPLGGDARWGPLLSATVVGFTAVVILGRAGEFVRPWLIARETRTSFPAQMAIWVFERIYDLLIVILFFGYGLVHLTRSGRVSGAGRELQIVVQSGGWAALTGGAICLAFIFGLRFLSAAQRERAAGWVNYLPERIASRLKPLASNFLEGAAASCDGNLQWRVMLYTFLEWVVIAGCQWSILRAFPATRHLSVSDGIAMVGLVSFGAVVQLPGIGGGMQVAAVAVLTQLFGVGIEEAASIALVLWATSFLLVVPVGLVMAVRRGLRFGQMRELA
jgi:hypothetical protein